MSFAQSNPPGQASHSNIDETKYNDDHRRPSAFSSSIQGSLPLSDDKATLHTLPAPSETDTRRRSVGRGYLTNSSREPISKEVFSSTSSISVSDKFSRDIHIDAKDLGLSDRSSEMSQEEKAPSVPTRSGLLDFAGRYRSWIVSALVVVVCLIGLVTGLTVYFHHRYVLSHPALPTIKTPLDAFNASATPFAVSKPPVRLAALWNFADPTIYYEKESSRWWAYATNGGAGVLNLLPAGSKNVSTVSNTTTSISQIQVATSIDFMTWDILPVSADPLPKMGAWVHVSNTTQSNATTTTTLIPAPSDVTSAASAFTTLPVSSTSTTTPSSSTSTSVPHNISLTHGANPWAPEVFHNPNTDTYILYYSAVSARHPTVHCIGAAVALSPAGPFTPQPTPIACPASRGGAIDPSVFIETVVADNGTTSNAISLLYKIDGNSIGHGGECNNLIPPLAPTPIMLQRMSPDGLTPLSNSPPIELLDRDSSEGDGPLIEAPSLVKVGATYALFYSSGCTRNADYNVKVATAPSIEGPWTRRGTLLKTGDFGVFAPGSATVRASAYAQRLASADGNGTVAHAYAGSTGLGPQGQALWDLVFHGRVVTEVGAIRTMFTSGLEFVFDEGQLAEEEVKEGASRKRTGIVRVVGLGLGGGV